MCIARCAARRRARIVQIGTAPQISDGLSIRWKQKPSVLKDSEVQAMESLAHPRAGDRPMPMPWSRPMACFASCFASCFARPHHAARGLGSQAVRQPRLRAVVASSVLDAPSRQHGCRGPRAPRGVWASCMRTATECAPPPPDRHRGAARAPPECAGVGAGEGL